ncbi:iron chelate uptake ABC transporter family permease subunit [Polaromonas sp. P1(28)-8]|nr:iron chelate uptake ABC transporter family permease subunit [Polaromonas sp. P1(28)-8]
MHLVLVGVAVTQLFAAGIDYLASARADRVALAVIWLRGSLWGRNWDHLMLALPLVPLLPVALLLAQRLNLLALGDAAAQALGVSVNNTRKQALLLAVLLASGAVAVAGHRRFHRAAGTAPGALAGRCRSPPATAVVSVAWWLAAPGGRYAGPRPAVATGGAGRHHDGASWRAVFSLSVVALPEGDMKARLCVERLTLDYGPQRVLDDVTLAIAEGTFTRS